MNNVVDSILSIGFIFTIIRVSTPILLASMGILISDRAGIINISTEGGMLTSALVGALVSAYTQNVWLGLLGAIVAGMLSALLLAYMSLNLKTDSILAGIAINIMASGGTIFFMYAITGDKGNTISLSSKVLPVVSIPIIRDIPVVGAILSDHNLMSYVAFLSVIGVYVLMNKTPLGFRIRSAGESPHALESVGISVRKVRYTALLLSGFFAGLAGAFMSMGYVSWFAKDMTAGRGFIALAAATMGKGIPVGTLISTLIFGVAEALSYTMQLTKVPTEFIQASPYMVTILGLVIYAIGKKRSDERRKLLVATGELEKKK